MTKHKLTRTCSACGIEKPLSAFLEVTQTHGTRYGAICSTCRAAGKGKKETKASDEGTVTLPGGARIGSKEKVFISKEQNRQIRDIKDLFQKEAQRRGELTEKKILDKDQKEKEGKDHRKFYIERKQQGFLGKTTQPVIINPERQAEIARSVEQHERHLETKKQEEVVRQELQINSLDLSTYTDTNMAKYRSDAFRQSDVFKQFAAWLGSDAPIVKMVGQLYSNKPGGNKSSLPQDKKPGQREQKGKEAIEDYLEKRWSPTTRGR